MSAWGWPQWLLLALFAIGYASMIHGDLKAPTLRQRYTGLFGTAVAIVLVQTCLYCGGFWSP